MARAMSPTSVFDNISNSNRQSDSPHKDHPRLKQLREFAKQDAKIQQAQKVKMEQKKPRKSLVEKTKRQVDNVQSAKISRAGKAIYIEKLEEELRQEEDAYLQIMANQYDLIKAKVELWNRIQELEERNTRAGLSQCCEESCDLHIISYGLFPESDINDVIKFQLENKTMSYLSISETDLEMLIVDEEEEPGTPPCSMEDTNTTSIIPEVKKEFASETSFSKCIQSPVSVYDVIQQVPDE